MGDYFDLKQTDLKLLEDSEGRICIVVHPDRKLDQTARRLNRLTKGANLYGGQIMTIMLVLALRKLNMGLNQAATGLI